jgi:tripeptidyl-peptidase-1
MFASLKRGALSLAVVSLLASTAAAEIFDKLAAVPEGKYPDLLHTLSSSGIG